MTAVNMKESKGRLQAVLLILYWVDCQLHALEAGRVKDCYFCLRLSVNNRRNRIPATRNRIASVYQFKSPAVKSAPVQAPRPIDQHMPDPDTLLRDRQPLPRLSC